MWERRNRFVVKSEKGSDDIMQRILSFWICASKQHTRFWNLILFLLSGEGVERHLLRSITKV